MRSLLSPLTAVAAVLLSPAALLAQQTSVAYLTPRPVMSPYEPLAAGRPDVTLGRVGSPLVALPLGGLWNRPMGNPNVVVRTGFATVGSQTMPLDSYAGGYPIYPDFQTLGYPYPLTATYQLAPLGGYNPVWSWYYDYPAEYVPPPLTLYVETAAADYTLPARSGSSTLQFGPTARDPNTAVITVQLPANATLFIDGKKQEGSGGARREVTTPTLEGGRVSAHEVKAVWEQDGKTVERVERLTLRAGDAQSVLFLPEPPR